MKELEITVKVLNTLEEAQKILLDQGFKLKESYQLNDIYLKKKTQKLCKRNILKVLSNSILLRDIILEDRNPKMITYKKKEYKNKRVLSERKYSVNITDIDKAYDLFLEIGFEKLIEVRATLYVYEKDGFEICFQNVENLGLLLEVESDKDYTGYDDNEIIKVKKQMLKDLSKYNLKLGKDYDMKKAYELIKKKLS